MADFKSGTVGLIYVLSCSDEPSSDHQMSPPVLSTSSWTYLPNLPCVVTAHVRATHKVSDSFRCDIDGFHTVGEERSSHAVWASDVVTDEDLADIIYRREAINRMQKGV